MRKAIATLLFLFFLGFFAFCPIADGKKPDKIKDGKLTDSNNDGVVEFAVPLYRIKTWYHECCDCGLVHKVTTQVIQGPIGLPWVHMRWERDERKTHSARVRKFGPDYRSVHRDIGAMPLEERGHW